jgi:hypothetical protein
MSISEISNTLGITRSVLNTICKNNDIEITSKFDIWKNRFDNIMKNIEFYVSENKTKTLLDISIENNISIETLKKVFNLTGNKVKLHSYNKSKGELECKNFIKEIGMECHSVKFDKKFEIDCFVDSNKFGVEYCGEYWHSYNVNGNKKYHQEKFEYFKSNGIRIFTVFECEWKYKNDIVRSMISSRLNVASRIFARKCNIKQISPNMAKRFHTENHISGGINCSINIGLYYNDNLITVLSITKSRYDKTFEYEIGRYSTLKNHVVVGGLGKMFKYFVNQYSPKSCITYADLRFGEGKCYEKIGFCLSGMTPPNYYYFKKNGCGIESRVKYQKHKLKDMPGFDINKTEFEIMSDNGYYRIYDCGNNKYTWTNY